MTRSFRVGHYGSLSAIPLLHAKIHGYFEAEGLQIDVVREFGLRSLINRCIEQQLDAACLPAPTPVVQSMHAVHEPLRWTLLSVLTRSGYGIVASPAAAQRLQRPRLGDSAPLRLGIPPTTTCAPLLVRHWHRSLNTELVPEPRLSIVPLSQMVDFLEEDVIDGFCAPEISALLAVERGFGQCLAMSQSLLPGHLNSVLTAPPGSALTGTIPRRSFLRALDRAVLDCRAGLPDWTTAANNPFAAHLPDLQKLLALRPAGMPDLTTQFTTGSDGDSSSKQDSIFLEECCFAFPGSNSQPRLLRKIIEQIYQPVEAG